MKNLLELIKDISSKYPSRTALQDSKESCDYNQMYKRIIRYAVNMLEYGVLKDQKVAVITSKSIESLLVIFAVMRSGAIPLLIDENDTEASILNKCKFMDVQWVILTSSDQSFTSIEIKSKVISQDQLTNKVSLSSDSNLNYCSEVCYMLTTSGTTGTPKGIKVSHKNILHYAKYTFVLIGSPDNLVCGHVTNFSTDLGHTNWILALISGGTLRVYNEYEAKDPKLFQSIIVKDKVNFVKTTPSHFDIMLPFLLDQKKINLDYLFLGGEKLYWQLVDKIYEGGLSENICNHYGPSETTIGALVYKIPKDRSQQLREGLSVPIGKPIGNNKAYLENSVAGVGELIIEGPGVCLGYYNNEKENKKRFEYREEKSFKTGDICEEVENGIFEFKERNDRQIKIRGYRVELCEIESNINSLESVEHVYLNSFEEDKQLKIEAFIKPKDIATFNRKEFLSELKDKLPVYKVPEYIYVREFAPLTSNGKINFSALREKKETVSEQAFDSWDSWKESVIHSWNYALGVKSSNLSDHFFNEGGNSLNAIKLIAKLQSKNFDVSIIDINKCPILEDFISLEKPKLSASFDDQLKSVNSYYNTLTFAQKNFFALDQENPNKYCQSILFESKKPININIFSNVIHKIRKIHPELCQQFYSSDFLECKTDSKDFSYSALDIYTLTDVIPPSYQILDITKNILEKIDIERGIVFKVCYIQDPIKNKSYLYFLCHHLVVDVISWNILLDEILHLYENLVSGNDIVLKREHLRYKFYEDIYQNNNSRSDLPSEDFNKEISKLPFIKTSNAGFGTDLIPFGQKLSDHLLDYSKKSGEKLNVILLSSLSSTLLDKYDQNEVSIDLEFHGRDQESKIDISRSISWWSTISPVHLNRKNNDIEKLDSYLSKVAQYSNKLNNTSSAKRYSSPKKSQIRFNYLGSFAKNVSNDEISLEISPISTYSNRHKSSELEYNLFFTARFIDQELIIDIQYDKKYLHQSDVQEISKMYMKNLCEKIGYISNNDELPTYKNIPSNVSSLGKPMLYVQSVNLQEDNSQTVFLTGCTGLLGINLLRELLLTNTRTNCLVRGKSRSHCIMRVNELLELHFPNENLKNHPCLRIYQGDLIDRHFGLDEEDYYYLANNCTQVVHSAADINLTKSIEELSEINITATEKIIEFANLLHKKNLHYVSTLAVSGVNQNPVVFSEDDYNVGQSFKSNYEKTKFIAEGIVRKSIEEGTEAKIYRVGHIANNSLKTDTQQVKMSNRVFQILNGMLTIRKVPIQFTEKVSFSYVDIISKMMTNVILGKIQVDQYCFHIENPNYLSFVDLSKIISSFGQKIDIVSYESFISNVEQGFHFEDVVLYQNWVDRYLKNASNVIYNNNRSIDLFSSFGIVFPSIEKKYLKNITQILESSALLV